ncbi:hypothetical protein F5B22DRAFT_594906 [Xylaria bambusicola]|uniref:uncharacterized protein n=1 Tax=Xylaria bambusicola TaxID=326684 RepID=UPI0020079BF5|nr:uncharacterized protein F5B22DRAFT_594906 [Xylaria bambusicola]KAI0521977.1 hypothetical protein F5B22DRAFT_594906 [Xylaria bambusicola]
MNASSLAFGFRALAFLSFLLLWGFYLLNGALKANVLAPLNGKLNEDIPLKNDYTGIFIIDYPVALLVAFFHFGTNGSDEGFQLLVFEGYSTLESSFVWVYAEMMRPGSKPWTIATPLLFATLSQFLGGAISLPLYYAYHLLWIDGADILRIRDRDAAMALPFSFLLGAILPAILACAPTWNGPDSRSPEAHQKYMAIFQVNPLWVTLLQTLLPKLFRWLHPNESSDRPQASKTAHTWVRTSYLLAAVSSAMGHIYTVARLYMSSEEGTNLARMRIPSPPQGPASGLPDVLARGTFLYLQYDVLIFDFASLSWAFLLLLRMFNWPKASNLTLAFIMFIGYLTIGAGATVSLALYVRESLLLEKGKGTIE